MLCGDGWRSETPFRSSFDSRARRRRATVSEISIIAGFAHVGLISGPALFGVTAHFFGLDRTMIVLAAVALSLGLACFAMPRFAAARN